MKPELTRLLLSCILVLQFAYGATDSFEFAELELVVESNTRSDRLHHGYTPHSFTINNYGPKVRELTLTLPATSEFEPFKINALTQTFTVPQGVHSVTVYQPPVPLSSLKNEVLVECEGKEGIIELGWEARIINFRNTGYLQRKSVLLARSQNQTQLEDAYSSEMLAAAGEGGENFMHADFLTDENEVENWQANWLAYSGYHAISISDAEWSRTAAKVKKALLHWTLAGGNLHIVGGSPEVLEGLPIDKNSNVIPMGLGRVEWIPIPANPVNTPTPGSTELLQSSLANTLLHNTEGWMPLLGSLAAGVIRMQEGESQIFRDEEGKPLGEPSYNEVFNIVEDAKAPVVFVITMLTLFIFLAGPVNLYVLNRMNKRTWFLWTLPAVSLLTSVIIFFVAFMGEGIEPTVRIDAVTFLNQESQEALTIGGIAAYSPISLPRLEFSGNSEVTPLIDWRSSDSGSNRKVEWQKDGSQWFTGKWVPSRIPAFFAVRKVEQRQEQLFINWEEPEPSVSNKLGVNLIQILACGPDGKVYSANKIPSDGKAELKLLGQKEPEDSATLKDLLKGTLGQDELREFPGPNPSEIPFNSYWAVLEDPTPFLENPVRFKKTKHLHVSHIIGQFGGPRE